MNPFVVGFEFEIYFVVGKTMYAEMYSMQRVKFSKVERRESRINGEDYRDKIPENRMCLELVMDRLEPSEAALKRSEQRKRKLGRVIQNQERMNNTAT